MPCRTPTSLTDGNSLAGDSQCHVFVGDGKSLGPDLTGMQRDDPQRLIVNIVEPQCPGRPSPFQVTLVETDEGRTDHGTAAEETDQQNMLIRTVNEIVPIQTSKIVARKLLSESLMPTGAFHSFRIPTFRTSSVI